MCGLHIEWCSYAMSENIIISKTATMKLVELKDFINFVRIKRIDRPAAKKNICSN